MTGTSQHRGRGTEIFTGLFLILSALAILASYLLDFEYPRVEEAVTTDLEYLNDNLIRQILSVFSWAAATLFLVLLLPFYLLLFNRYQRFMHILNGMLILATAYFFMKSGLTTWHMVSLIRELPEPGNLSAESVSYEILIPWIQGNVAMDQWGRILLGLFLFSFSMVRLKAKSFPLFASILLFLSGPLIVLFSWTDPGHILLTSAMAASTVGMLLGGAFLVNRGFRNTG